MKRDGYSCVYTKDPDFVIHHLISFNTLLEQASETTKVPILAKIEDYSNYYDFIKLNKELLRLHTLSIGITISKKIHSEFHKRYGLGNNTPQQFEDFIKNYIVNS